MKLSAVQNYVKDQILASATLAAFGEPLLASLENDDAAFKEIIDTRLRSPGVCIEIGYVSGASIGVLHPGGFSRLRADFDVFVAEKIAAPTHTPRGIELVETVVAALTSGRQPVEWVGHESFISEHGYSLHILGFNVPVVVTK